MALRRWTARLSTGLAVGLGLTLAGVLLHLLGLTQRVELLVYDYYVRHFSRIPASSRIVHVDIDDDSLQRVGSWPWPRDVQAALISILHELGASRIVMDIVLSEPRPGEMRLPGLDATADIEGQVEQIGEPSPENIVFPDLELAEAIARAGNVYLSMYDEAVSQRPDDTDLTRRVMARLRENFEQDEAEIARQLGTELKAVGRVIAHAKSQVAHERVREVLAANPDASFPDVHAAILHRPFEDQTADRADVLLAYMLEQNLEALRERCRPIPPALQGRLPRVRHVVAPLDKFTQGSQGIGFVSFTRMFDGVMRQVPLLVEWDGLLLEQLGFAAVRDELGIRVEDLAFDSGGRLLIPGGEGRPELRIPLTGDGQMLINWHVEEQWEKCFTHLPVTQLLRIYDCQRRRRENDIARQVKIGRVVALSNPTDFGTYRDNVNKLLEEERSVRWARLRGRQGDQEVQQKAQSAETRRRGLEAEQQGAIEYILNEWESVRGESRPSDAAEAADFDRIVQAAHLIRNEIPRYEEANRRIAAEEAHWRDQLRPLIADKICFVGYTATAVADMVNTPAYHSMPGVLVHSSLLNSVLQGQFRSWSWRGTEALVIALVGLSASVITATRGPRLSLAIVVAMTVVLFVLNGLGLFERMNYWLELVTALGTGLVTWALIVLARYLTTEREKRRFSRAVAQYVSPAMARQIADSAEDFDLAPVEGRVTCFFSDLAGFTRISERLGPAGTRTVLNPYLEAMSVVLHQHNALINKFMGDGIFAFFNPPILPCADHELAACEAALESRAALQELKRRHEASPLAEEYRQLAMRIGISTGPVFVGDYGSENKLDYTCVGDTVNLASRLESANKLFGSAIMLAGSSRDAVGERFLFRPLGAIQVKGQTVAVRVYELLGRDDSVNGDVLAFAEAFEDGVAAFSRRDWSGALAAFERCSALRPSDPGAFFYLRAIQEYRQRPLPDSWSGGLELTEK